VSRLQDLRQQVQYSMEPDRWWWKPDPDGIFSVKSNHSLIFKELNDEVDGPGSDKKVFDRICRSLTPSKIIYNMCLICPDTRF
jgi:hypothetical protein